MASCHNPEQRRDANRSFAYSMACVALFPDDPATIISSLTLLQWMTCYLCAKQFFLSLPFFILNSLKPLLVAFGAHKSTSMNNLFI